MAKLSMIAKALRTPKFGVHGNRCRPCGRPRGYLRKFELCRTCFRQLAFDGQPPGRGRAELVARREVSAMKMTDPIADLLTHIRNGVRAKLLKVDVPATELKVEISQIFKEEGFIRTSALEGGPRGTLQIFLPCPSEGAGHYRHAAPCRPGLGFYRGGWRAAAWGGIGIAVVSTSRGPDDRPHTPRVGVGGEVICSVWWGACDVARRKHAHPRPQRRQGDGGGGAHKVQGPKGPLSSPVPAGVT